MKSPGEKKKSFLFLTYTYLWTTKYICTLFEFWLFIFTRLANFFCLDPLFSLSFLFPDCFYISFLYYRRNSVPYLMKYFTFSTYYLKLFKLHGNIYTATSERNYKAVQ